MLYLFQTGHQPQLSIAEFLAVFSMKNPSSPKLRRTSIQSIKRQNNNYLILDTDDEINPEKLMAVLGGTIKICIQIPPSEGGGEPARNASKRTCVAGGGVGLVKQLANHLMKSRPEGKIEFSLNDEKLALQTKRELKMLNRSVRYIEPKNTATILHNKLVDKKSDLTIIDDNIFFTVAIQPFEEMGARDYGRPGSDNFSGMLPPKLARIMINLAMSATNTGVETRLIASLLDPFCGSGTILTEAIDMGYTNLIGSDISDRAISDSEKNIAWLLSKYQISDSRYQLYTSDATKLDTVIKPNSVDAIVTEPSLGQALRGSEKKDYLEKQANELGQLYIESFKAFHKILKPNAVAVFIIPKFKLDDDWIEINVKNEIEKIGFEMVPFKTTTISTPSTTITLEHLSYFRPTQHLARTIWRFKKTPASLRYAG